MIQVAKGICRKAVPLLAVSLKPLAQRRNAASLNRFYLALFGRCSSERAHFVPRPFSRGRSTRYSDRLHDSSATIPTITHRILKTNSIFHGK